MMLDSIVQRLKVFACDVNDSAAIYDSRRNYMHFGYVLALLDVVRDMGNTVEIVSWPDLRLCLNITAITINGVRYSTPDFRASADRMGTEAR